MIISFRDRRTRIFAEGGRVKEFSDFAEQAHKRLRLLHLAKDLPALRSIRSNRPEALRGGRAGQFSIRINDQWRVCFEWQGGSPGPSTRRSSMTMTEKFVTLGGPPIHPDEVLADELAELGANASDVARAIGVLVNRITEILGGRRSITADTALRLGRFLGAGPEIWLSLQQDYDLRTTRRQIGAALRRIPHRRIVKAARSA